MRAIHAFVGAAAFLVLGACSEKPAATTSTTAAQSLPPADASYTARGRIDGLPTPDGKSYLHIHHETIPEFKGRDGTVTGMNEMSMDFIGVSPSVDLSKFAIGDAVEFTFEVRWKSSPRTLVTMVKKLPPDVALKLINEPAKPGS